MVRKTIINGGIGPKVICVVTNDELDALPILGTDNGDGTASLTTNSSMAVLPDTVSGDLAAINSASASIDGKLPALVDGKIPVDVSVSIDSVDIGDVDIKEFPAGNLGQQLKAASLSVAPATDIVDATYIGDIKFGESLPAGSAIVGQVGIDQTTPGTTNLVNVNGGASQTSDIKVTLDSESVNVTGPLTDTELRNSDIKVTLDSEKVAVSGIDAGTNLIGKVSIDQVTAHANEVVVTTLAAPATLPLPTGAATSTKQDTGNSSLTSIDGKLGASAIGEYNMTLTMVDTEYSQALPANTKGIEFMSRGGYPVRFAFTTGKVATPTGVYFTLKSNCVYESPAGLNLSSKTIYFASDNAGDVVEMIAWS